MTRLCILALLTAKLMLAAPLPVLADVRIITPNNIVGQNGIVAPNNIIAPNNVTTPNSGRHTGVCGRVLVCQAMPEEEEPMPQLFRMRR